MAIQSSNDAIRNRIRIAAILFVAFFLYLGWFLYGVQIKQHEYLYEKAREKYTTVKRQNSKRGEIFDIYGNLLVANTPCVDIAVDPSLVKEEQISRIAWMLEQYLGLPREEAVRKLTSKQEKIIDGKKQLIPRKYESIQRYVDFDVAETIREVVAVNKFQGVDFRNTYKRDYTKSELLSNILGFTSMDHDKIVAVMGIEKFYNKEMQSVAGSKVYERSRDGRPLPYGNSEEEPGKNGLNIYLTIQEPIQAILEEELDNLFRECSPRAAYAVMADPKTGNIIAVAQRPSFNPNDRSSLTADAYRIRFIEDSFEPGSIMKPLPISGAIDCGVITRNTVFDCENGIWHYRGSSMRDSSKRGKIPVWEIVKLSSNIGTAKIGIELGESRLYEILVRFGLGQRTGLPLQPETVGQLKKVKDWDGLSITRFPIGYGVGVSPVQMVRAYCALANYGNLRELRLVDRVEDPDTGEVIVNPQKEPVPMFRSPNTWAEIVDMMVGVTADGTGKKAAIPGFRVAGKSGTSRKWGKNGYEDGKYYASFVGFVPAEDAAFVLWVTVDEPKGNSYYGGSVAGPAFKAIAARTLRYMDIKPDPALMPEPKTQRR